MARTSGHRLAVVAGALRFASGVSFLVAPRAAGRAWGNDDDNPRAQLLLRSMGYRDALIGALLFRSGRRGDRQVVGWFLASAGADLADLVGGLANHDRLDDAERRIGIGGAAVAVGVGVGGAVLAATQREVAARPE